jgi:opacity protein-like surface antigen
MRRLVPVALLLLVAAFATAQPLVGGFLPTIKWGAHVNFNSASLPGPSINGRDDVLKDVYSSGFGGGLHLDIHLAMLGFHISGDYLKFSPDNDKYRDALASYIGTAAGQFSVSGGGISLWSLTFNAKMGILPIPILKPYLTAGLGWGKINVDEATITQGAIQTKQIQGFTSESKGSYNLGLGVDLDVGSVTLFIEARYMWINTDPKTSTMVPVSVGISF